MYIIIAYNRSKALVLVNYGLILFSCCLNATFLFLCTLFSSFNFWGKINFLTLLYDACSLRVLECRTGLLSAVLLFLAICLLLMLHRTYLQFFINTHDSHAWNPLHEVFSSSSATFRACTPNVVTSQWREGTVYTQINVIFLTHRHAEHFDNFLVMLSHS